MLERVFAPGHGLSQLVTSFVASESQGILHVPFSPFLIFWSFSPVYAGCRISCIRAFCVGIDSPVRLPGLRSLFVLIL